MDAATTFSQPPSFDSNRSFGRNIGDGFGRYTNTSPGRAVRVRRRDASNCVWNNSSPLILKALPCSLLAHKVSVTVIFRETLVANPAVASRSVWR